MRTSHDGTIGRLYSLEPTYEGLKASSLFSTASSTSSGLEPTYEGLKDPCLLVLRFKYSTFGAYL